MKLVKAYKDGVEYLFDEWKEPIKQFSYDFRGKTTQQAQSDGWTITSASIDSGGAYNGHVAYPLSNVGVIDNTKKITINADYKSGTVGSRTNAFHFGLNNNTSVSDATGGNVYVGLMTNSDYKLRWIIFSSSGGESATNNVTWNSNTEYSGTYIIDLPNKKISFSATKKSDGSSVVSVEKTITDSQVSSFVGTSYLGGYTGNTCRIETMKITIE